MVDSSLELSNFKIKALAVTVGVLIFSSSIPLGGYLIKPAYGQFASLTNDQLTTEFQDSLSALNGQLMVLDEAAILDILNNKIGSLQTEVNQLQTNNNLPPGVGKILGATLVTLGNAQHFILSSDKDGADNMIKATDNVIDAFIHSVNAQSGKKIDVDTANHLISEAEQILRISQLRGKDLSPFVTGLDMPLTTQIMNQADAEYATMKGVMAELQSRGVKVDIQITQHSPAVVALVWLGVTVIIPAAVSAYIATNELNNALVSNGQQPLSPFDKFIMFNLNFGMFVGLNLTVGKVAEKQVFTDLMSVLLGRLSPTQFWINLVNSSILDTALTGFVLIPEETHLVTYFRSVFGTGMLTVIKRIINTGGGTLTLSGVTLMINGTTVSNGTANSESPGKYVVSEASIPGYSSSINGDCTPSGTITLAAGGSKTCVITNTFAPFTSHVFLNDQFTSDLEGWTHFGYPGYVVSLDTSTGQLAPSAHISGDAFLGICSFHGMAKPVDISSYTSGPLTLAFDWRASSTSGIDTTQAEVRVDNANTGTPLFVHRLVNSGIFDTGWQFYSTDISSYVSGVNKIQIDLYLYDCWIADWSENNWYDNVSLFTGTTPPPGVVLNTNLPPSPPPGAPYFYPEVNQTSVTVTRPNSITIPLSVEWEQGWAPQPVSITLGNLTNTNITYSITSIRNTTSYQLFNVTFNVPTSTQPNQYLIPAYINEIGTTHTKVQVFSIGVR